jgi:2,5-furandicarboxylate decarboxylase 1
MEFIDAHPHVDFDRFRLRTFLETLREAGQLEVHDGPFDLVNIAAVLEGNALAVLFQKVGPEGWDLAGNVAASRKRLALAFGTTVDGVGPEVQRRLRLVPEIVEVARAQAPVQQVVLTGDEADLTMLPVHLQHGLDGGLYISSSTDFTIDRATGWTNIGMRRLMLRGRRETGIDLVAPSDLRAIYDASFRAGERLPLSFVVGSHPIDHVASTMRFPGDELELLASLRAAPLPVVKCVTNDVRVPADSEWVIEGYLDERGWVEAEGPYGEFLGYYGVVKQNPVFHVTAITRRHDAVFQTSTIGGYHLDCTDTAQLGSLRTEVTLRRALETAVREVTAVHATTSSGGSFNVRVALRQRVPGEARNAIAAVFASLVNVKHVFVVDPDIDVFSDAQMDWALATRFQADRDLVVHSGFRAMPLDPSLVGAATTAKAGFDLTLPFGSAGRSLDTLVPEPPRFDGARFASIEAALADGPKTFEALMAATGTRDGREIVLTLETLRSAGRLTRDRDGRYLLSRI